MLEGFRQGRNDTDCRVSTGRGKALFRINIKAHGSLFLNAPGLVHLPTEDCFPLGTYKFLQASTRSGARPAPSSGRV